MRVENRTSHTPHILRRILLFGVLILIATAMAFVLWYSQSRVQHSGVVYGVPEEIHSGGDLRGLGVNIDLTQLDRANGTSPTPYTMDDALEDIKRAGLSWIRQPFPWSEIEPQRGQFDWSMWDDVISACERHQLDLVAVLYTSPVWARDLSSRDQLLAPPESLVDFGGFVQALASRYGPSLDYYQIWDAPNIYPNWGDSLIDSTGYMRLLREATIQIRDVDPTATVVLAGLAPTTQPGPVNMSEALFLQELYDAGAAPFFDVMAAKPYGFWSGPDDRRVDATVLNFSRVTLLRDVMVRNGDSKKPVWAVEIGWNALPSDWSGGISPWGTDVENLQAERTLEAIERARIEWPWLAALGLAEFLPPENPDDPRSGFALLDRNHQPRELNRILVEMAQDDIVAYPGHHRAGEPAVQYSDGQWRVREHATDVGEEGDVARLVFYGTRIDLEVRRGRFWGFFTISIDGQPANRLPKGSGGRAYLVLHDPLEREATVTLASGLEDGLHQLEITAHGGWEQWPLSGFTVVRERNPTAADLFLAFSALLELAGVGGILYNGFFLPWDSWWPAALRWFESLGPVQLALLALLVIIFHFSPNAWLSLLCLGGLAVIACLRPVLGLAVVTFAIPFFLEVKHLPGRSFGLTELALMLAAASLMVHFGLQGLSAWKRGSRDRLSGWGSIWQAVCSARPWRAVGFDEVTNLDFAMLLLVVAGIISVLAAENFGVANREFRVVILEPAVFYVLLRIFPGKRRDIWLLSDVLILAGVAVAVIGLHQYFFTTDIISAEGVRRIRGVYASPNNLSLFLGRLVSFLAALLLSSSLSRRQILYGLAVVPMLICLYLTYSRGAWLVGLPVALLFVVIVRRGRALWMGLVALGLLVLSLIPLGSTERLSQLLNMQSETAFLRIRLWQGTLQMIREHPLLGVGPDNFLYQYRTRYVLPDAWREPNLSHPHNIILDYWTRLGILGLLALLWQQWNFFKLGLKTYRGLPNVFEQALGLALLTSMVYSLAHGLIDNSFFLVDLSFVLVLTIGLMIRLSGNHLSKEQLAGERSHPAASLIGKE